MSSNDNNDMIGTCNCSYRLDSSKSGSLDGQGKKKLLSLNENLDSFRHIDSVEESINMEDAEDVADQE